MSKVICDICGTVYQDTAESCPICGYSRLPGNEELEEDILKEEAAAVRGKGGRFAMTNSKKKNKEIFDYDEVNSDEEEEEEEEETYDEDEDYEEAPKSNTVLVVILVIVIMLLLAAAGYIFLRFFLPNRLSGNEETPPTTVAAQPVVTEEEEPTELTFPCEKLSLMEAPKELNAEGQFYLLNVKVVPEYTTDELVYVSGDESIVTITEDGKIIAVGQGETSVYITCGSQQIICPVSVKYIEETEPPTEETVDPTAPVEDPSASEESTAPKNTTLKLKKTDITLYVGYGFQLELDCDLDPSELEWSVEHNYIVSVDETGFITALSRGTTAVIVKYGDEEVECIVRCV